MAEMLRPKKKAKKQNLSTITLGYLHSKQGSCKEKNQKRVKILFDTGCGATLIHHSLVKKLKQKDTKPSNWSTKAAQRDVRLTSLSLHSMTKETFAGQLL